VTPLAPLLAAALAAAPLRLDAPGFGKVAVHAPAGSPARVVLLLSGAGGLDASATALAAALAAKGALVVGVDTPDYLATRPAGKCVYPAGDLEELAQHVEKVQGVPEYRRPVVVGHSRGAALAWAAVSNAPPGTFLGAVAVAPCPERALPVKLCAHGAPPRTLEGGTLPPLEKPPAPMEVIAGAEDTTCPAPAAAMRCPMQLLVELTATRSTWSPRTTRSAAHSLRSFMGVEVPCALI
jgi:type IV secretory pathway VirJ component